MIGICFLSAPCHQTLDDDEEEYDPDDVKDRKRTKYTHTESEIEIDPLDAFMKGLNTPKVASIPSSSSSTAATAGTEEEIDPLDAFMSTLKPTPSNNAVTSSSLPSSSRQPDLSLDDEDPMSSYIDATSSATGSGASIDPLIDGGRTSKHTSGGEQMTNRPYRNEGENDDDDDDDIPSSTAGFSRAPISLPPIDHSTIAYPIIRQVEFQEHTDVSLMSEAELELIRADLCVSLEGGPTGGVSSLPRPCLEWEHFGFSHKLLTAIVKQGFDAPTPIQSIAIPMSLSGMDLIGLARTGSGKTASFLWPMIEHILVQEDMVTVAHSQVQVKGAGPIGMILAPTRELADQIFKEAWKYCRSLSIRICPLMGGMQRYEQVRSLAAGCEMVIGTPGRVLDLLSSSSLVLLRCSYVVLDEADRMLSLGFESQLKQIMSRVRPERQIAMFSATMEPRLERVSNKFFMKQSNTLTPVIIRIGEQGQVNPNVRQEFVLLANKDEKVEWTLRHISQLLRAGPALVFAGSRVEVEDVARRLTLAKVVRPSSGGDRPPAAAINGHTNAAADTNFIRVGTLHGQQHQMARMETLAAFRGGKVDLLVATDVAARGLDIKDLPTVICFEPARNIDSHVHRVGRTGRAGAIGRAISLLLPSDQRWATSLIQLMEKSTAAHVAGTTNGQAAPELLKHIAMGRARTVPGGVSTMVTSINAHSLPPPPPPPHPISPSSSPPFPPPPPPPPPAASSSSFIHPSRLGLVPHGMPPSLAHQTPSPYSTPSPAFGGAGGVPFDPPHPPHRDGHRHRHRVASDSAAASISISQRQSYHAVPPPAYHAVPPPTINNIHHTAPNRISLAATIAAAHARAAAILIKNHVHPESTPAPAMPAAAAAAASQ